MKKIVCLIILLIFATRMEAQVETKNINVVKLVPEQNFLINGTANATLAGGRDRITVQISLPEGTKEWVYVFSCSSSNNGQGVIQLCSNLTKAIDLSGTTADMISAITAPDGDANCDVFLLDKENKDLFESEAEFSYFTIGRKLNIKNGVMPIRGLNNGPYYIGIRNNYTTNAINVKIEAAALVENTEVDLTQWSVEKKNEMYEVIKAELIKEGMEEAAAKKLTSCIIKKLVVETSLDALSKMADFEKEELLNKIDAECRKETGN